MRSTTTAASSRSARCLGKSLPRLGWPTWWPARPMRCRPRDTAPGDSTCTTRSTAPMSMPSSSDEVATRPRSRPVFSSSSMSSRRSRGQRAVVGLDQLDALLGRRGAHRLAAPGLAARRTPRSSREASRSASRRALTKMIVERCFSTSSTRRGCMAGQIERRAGPAAALPVTGSSVTTLAHRPQVLDGDDHLHLERLADPGVDHLHRAGLARARSSRPGSGRSRRAGAGWPTARCAGEAAPPAAPAVRA